MKPLKQLLHRVYQRSNFFFRDLVHLTPAERLHWEQRIRDVVACPDNEWIPRHPDAGRIVAGMQIMHNGLSVVPGGYYGGPTRKMLMENRGVHEPQEERVFAEVLKCMPSHAVMLELGSYWSYYSMWFQSVVEKAQCIMVEPDFGFIEVGKNNFRANGLTGEFIQAYIGAHPGGEQNGVAVTSVDTIIDQYGIKNVNILHSDIQGAELDMLHGANNSIATGKIQYIFISTHENGLHQSCLSYLKERGFVILAEADLNDTYSWDGLIAARSPRCSGCAPISISKKGTSESPDRKDRKTIEGK